MFSLIFLLRFFSYLEIVLFTDVNDHIKDHVLAVLDIVVSG